MNKDYINLVSFWDNSFILKEEDKQELQKLNPDEDWKSLAPSEKQFNILQSFNGKNNVLDYGCGSGWASIIMAKSNVKRVVAADVSSNSIKMVDCYREVFKVSDIIHPVTISSDFLSHELDNTYDGFFSSNVIDVIPLEMAKEIIKESSRVTKPGTKVIFSLNYYIDPIQMEKRGCKINGSLIYINDVLRLNSLTDNEWINIFKEYFNDIKLDYFAWPGESKETRRLFVLRK